VKDEVNLFGTCQKRNYPSPKKHLSNPNFVAKTKLWNELFLNERTLAKTSFNNVFDSPKQKIIYLHNKSNYFA